MPPLVERAAQIVGGIDRLAAYLEVEEHRVRFWRNGTATAPDHIVVELVDLVLQDDVARADEDRRRQPRALEQVLATRI